MPKEAQRDGSLYRKAEDFPGMAVVTLELDDYLIEYLENQARARKITVDEIVEECLRAYLEEGKGA